MKKNPPRNANGHRILNVITQDYIEHQNNVYDSPHGTYSAKSLANVVFDARFRTLPVGSGPRREPKFPLRANKPMTSFEQTDILKQARAGGWVPDDRLTRLARDEIRLRWHNALVSGNVTMVRKLIEGGVDVNSTEGLNSHTPLSIVTLHTAHPTAVIAMLIAAGADVNAVVALTGNTHLGYAIHMNRLDVMSQLLAAGAHVDAVDGQGQLALVRAAVKENEEFTKRLLAAGATVDAKTRWGDTALAIAADRKNVRVVKVLLDAGADTEVGAESGGDTPLMRAVQYGHVPLTTMLLAAGANVNVADDRGTTVLMTAVLHKRPDVVAALLRAHPVIDARDVTGTTALIFAAAVNRVSIVNQLLEAGADITARNKAGHTPLGIALERRFDAMAGFLRIAGGVL